MKAGHIGIGVAAGIVSVLLVATLATGTVLSSLLVFLAPLPLIIAGLGWDWRSTLIGTVLGAALFGLLAGPAAAFVHLLSIGAPATGLCYLALLGRPAEESADESVRRAGGVEWYPVGRLVFWIALLATLMGWIWALRFGFSLESYMTETRQLTEAWLRLIDDMVRLPPPGETYEQLVQAIALLWPPIIALVTCAVLVFNLWLGGRIVVRSERSPRPWLEAWRFRLPPAALPAYLAAIAAWLFAPDMIGLLGRVAAFSLTFVYALQGLAVIHVATLGGGGRWLLLGALYFILFAFWPSIFALALLGLLDPFFNLRGKAAGVLPPPPRT